NTLTVTETDTVGNSASASIKVTLDTVAPVVKITSPADNSVVKTPNLTVNYTLDGVAKTKAFTLTEGLNTLTVTETDTVGNSASASIKVTLDTVAPVVKITSPADNSVVNTRDITVNYTVDGIAKTKAFTLVAGLNTLTVTEVDTAGNSSSASIRVTLGTAPNSPSNLTAAAISPSQINLTWQDNSNNETTFTIARKLDSDASYQEIATVGANVTSYSDTGLNGNTTYHYIVCAHNSVTNSMWSNEASATTASSLAAPSNLAAKVSSSRIRLTWTDNSKNETGFKIERRTGATGVYGLIATVKANRKTYTDASDLKEGMTYYYRICAYNDGENSQYSNEASAMLPVKKPKTPSKVTASVLSLTHLILTWTDKSDNEEGFVVERKVGSKGSYVVIAKTAADATTIHDNNLTPGTRYYYRVAAYNSAGQSGYSTETIMMPKK
ncbi:MAG: fibronectin type III domain-containing protein, partial [Candidatus Omnitrophica bacterium]|nr:fibronectin type III domain-containing protein [Candidatus Omnitrophota bacterium]